MKKYRSASFLAMHDITEWMRENDIEIIGPGHDVWVVTPNILFTKEARRKNKELGIKGLNSGRNLRPRRSKNQEK